MLRLFVGDSQSPSQPSPQTDVYVHIGLHKTGTTFLQRLVFPRWPGMSFYHDTMPVQSLVWSWGKRKLLISNESLWCNAPSGPGWWESLGDPALVEESIAGVARTFPEASILISFRRHADMILSLYLQYLQQGGTQRFEGFLDWTGDRGLFSKRRLCYRQVIESVQRNFARPPMIYLQEDLRRDLPAVLAQMAEFFGCPAPSLADATGKQDFGNDLRKVNRSVGHYQAKVLRAMNRLLVPLHAKSKAAKRVRKLCQYGLLARLLPYRHVTLAPELRSAMDEYYAEDWKFVLDKIDKKKWRGSAAFQRSPRAA